MLAEDVAALWASIAAVDDRPAFLSKLDRVAGMAEAYGTVPRTA